MYTFYIQTCTFTFTWRSHPMKLVWRFKIIAFILQLKSANMKKKLFFNVFQIPQIVSAFCLSPHSCVSEIRIGIGIRCRASQLPRTGIGRYFFFFFDGCYCYCYWRDLDVIVIVIDGLCKNLCRFHTSFSKKNHSQLPLSKNLNAFHFSSHKPGHECDIVIVIVIILY